MLQHSPGAFRFSVPSPTKTAEQNSGVEWGNCMTDRHPSTVEDALVSGQPCVLARGQWATSGFYSATQNIRGGTTWGIQRKADTVIVHMGGRIDRLETELDGCGSLSEPPMAGEIWIVPSGQRYGSHARGGLVHYAELHLNLHVAKAIVGREAFLKPVRPRAGCFDPFLYRAVQRLEALSQESDDVSRLAAESLIQTILLDFYGRYGEGEAPAALSRQIRFSVAERNAIGEYIAANLGEPLRLEVLAARVLMTVHEFLIAFRAGFHTTPAQYVMEQRVRRARWLLQATRKTVAEIAYETGFSSHAHLSTVFRKRVGATPNAFRAER